MNFKFTYPNAKELAGELKAVKTNYHLSNNYLAQEIGTSAAVVSNWLNFKTSISSKYHTIVEDFIARTWQPALIFITPFDNYINGLFLNVGDKYDPFYSWIHNSHTSEEAKEYDNILIQCKKAVNEGRAKILIVELFKDLNEASTRGRIEEQLYTVGAINPAAQVHILGNGKCITYQAKVFKYENS